MELSMFAEEHHIDMICIAELGSRRKIAGFCENECDDRYTQSGIFWGDSVQIEKIRPPAIQIFANNGIMTQIVKIYGEMILIHIYIPPDTERKIRKAYWNQIVKFTETRDEPILDTGDLIQKIRGLG